MSLRETPPVRETDVAQAVARAPRPLTGARAGWERGEVRETWPTGL